MELREHAITGLCFTAFAAWAGGPAAATGALAGSVLLDADHYLWYAVRFRDASLPRALQLFASGQQDRYYCLCVLHTFEFIAVYIALVSLTTGLLWWLGAGALLHLVLDTLDSAWKRGLSRRYWSLTRGLLYAATSARRQKERHAHDE